MIMGFLASQFSGWCVMYPVAGALASSGVAGLEILASPELAVAFLVTRVTRRIRMPANLALAAGLVQVLPGLSTVKVTPLVTGMTPMDPEAKMQVANLWRRVPVPLQQPLEKVGTFLRWLEGPVDKYGMALYLSGRVTALATTAAGAVAVSQGMDMTAWIASWGFDAGDGAMVGTVAGAAVLNTFLLPAHLLVSVYGTEALERWARLKVARENAQAALMGPAARRKMQQEAAGGGAAGGGAAGGGAAGAAGGSSEDRVQHLMRTRAMLAIGGAGLLYWKVSGAASDDGGAAAPQGRGADGSTFLPSTEELMK